MSRKQLIGMIENFKLSIQAIWSHKLRSLLTMLGVIIGIAAIISIFSLINGNTEKMKQQIVGDGNNTIDVIYGAKSMFNSSLKKEEEKRPDFVPLIPEEEINNLSNSPEVKEATLYYQQYLSIFRQNESSAANVNAVHEKYFEIQPLTLLKGRRFNEADYAGRKQVVLLDERVYSQLFPEDDGLEQMVEINGQPFKIIGVVKDEQANPDYAPRQSFIPANNWIFLTGKINPEPIVKLQTNNMDELQPTSNQVIRYLNQKLPQSDFAFGVTDLSDLAKNMEEINQSSYLLLIGIASISLLVGGIGVMNIMLVSVTERTREIGLKKALGARRSVILLQFLTESVTLTIVGGILGILLGLIIGKLGTQAMGTPFVLSPISIVGSLIFSCTIGIVFGIIPAVKASKMNPIEALRFG